MDQDDSLLWMWTRMAFSMMLTWFYLRNNSRATINKEPKLKKYYETVKAVWSDRIGDGANKEQFIEGMKKYVNIGLMRGSVDKDGVVTLDEHYKFLKAAANMSDEAIDLLFSKADLNQNGVLSPEELEAETIEFVLSA